MYVLHINQVLLKLHSCWQHIYYLDCRLPYKYSYYSSFEFPSMIEQLKEFMVGITIPTVFKNRDRAVFVQSLSSLEFLNSGNCETLFTRVFENGTMVPCIG